MSYESTHDHHQQRQQYTKRRRSHSAAGSDNSDERHEQLRYAYDEESDADRSFHTPEQGSDNEDEDDDAKRTKRRKIERPTRLNYVLQYTLRGHKGGVAAVKFSPDRKWIASCCE